MPSKEEDICLDSVCTMNDILNEYIFMELFVKVVFQPKECSF